MVPRWFGRRLGGGHGPDRLGEVADEIATVVTASTRSVRGAVLRAFLLVVVAGTVFGAVSGIAGAAALHEMESSDGVGNSGNRTLRRLLGLLALPALPGHLIAEHRSGVGGDWQLDEAWFFRWQICGWNALAWASVAAALSPVAVLWMVARRNSGRTSWSRSPT